VYSVDFVCENSVIGTFFHLACDMLGADTSQVGIMITGVTIDSTVAGGPAFNSKKLSRGDVILKVDGNSVTNENIFQLLVGRDVPGSSVELCVAKGGSQARFRKIRSTLLHVLTNQFLFAVIGCASKIDKDGNGRNSRQETNV
jgi:C-terminal processing protease CtpA/Prc